MASKQLGRKTTIGLVVIMLIYILTALGAPFVRSLAVYYYTEDVYHDAMATRFWVESLHVIFTRGFALAVGVFLIFEARRAGYHRTLWFSLGAVFGLIALILFYIYRIYENIQSKEKE